MSSLHSLPAFALSLQLIIFGTLIAAPNAQSAPGEILTRTYSLAPGNGIYREYTYYLDPGEVLHGYYREWWIDLGVQGNLMLERHYSDGELNGVESTFYMDGGPNVAGQWANGLRTGTWRSYYANGAPKTRDDYSGGQLHGSRERWAQNGVKTDEDQWLNGQPHEIYKRWDPDTGNLLIDGTYDQGNKEGTWRQFRADGQILGEEDYVAGVRTGYREWLYNSETGESRGQRGYDASFLKSFHWVIFDAYGVKTGEGDYSADLESGVWKYFHPGGQISSQGAFVAGQRQGRWNSWDEDENLTRESDYETGTLIRYTTYEYEPWLNDTVFLQRKTGYTGDGRRDGPLLEFWDHGGKSQETWFLKGVLHGLNAAWDRQGNPLFESNWRYGLLNGLDREWHATGFPAVSTGMLKWERTHKDGLLNGVWHKWYDVTGNFVKEYERTYRQGVLHGPSKEWSTDGVGQGVLAEGEYSNGQKCGMWTYFDLLMNRFSAPTMHGVCIPLEPPPSSPDTLPDLAPPDGPQKKEVRGFVIDNSSGNPLPGADVTVGGQATVSDALGFFSEVLDPADSYAFSVAMSGFSTHTGDIDMTGSQQRTVNVRLRKTPIVSAVPQVVSVESEAGRVFIANVQTFNRYIVRVNWNGETPGKVRFDRNGNVDELTANAQGSIVNYDMGTEFIPSLHPEGNTLTVTAITSQGIESEPVEVHPLIFPLPKWLASSSDLAFKTVGTRPVYAGGLNIPAMPVSLLINKQTLGPVAWDLYHFIPVVGGTEWGLNEFQVTGAVTLGTDGSGSGKLGVQGALVTMSKGNSVNASGTLWVRLKDRQGWVPEKAEGAIGASGGGTLPFRLSSVFRPIAIAKTKPFIGRFATALDEKCKVIVVVKVEGGAAFRLEQTATGNRYGVKYNAGPTFGTGLTADLGPFKFTGTFTGTGKFNLDFPDLEALVDSLNLSSFVTLELKATGSWAIWGVATPFSESYPFTFPSQGAALTPDGGLSPDVSFRPVSRGFLDQAGYNRFLADRRPGLQGVANAGAPAPAALDETLVQNVYPYSEPCLAELNGRRAIAYVYLDPNDADLQATEIFFTYFDGASYTTPAPIVDDTRAEFAPCVAFDANGKIVAAWERIKDPDFSGVGPEDIAPRMEIVYAVYDPAVGSWSAPIAVTDNDHLDHGPRLLRGMGAQLALVWFGNEANELVGTPANPSQLNLAFWDAGSQSFSTPTTLPGGMADALDVSFAYDGSEFVAAYAHDEDGDPATADDLEIYYARHQSGAWSSPVRLTDDGQSDSQPQVLFMAAGQKELVWLKADGLDRLTDWDQGSSETIRAGADSLGLSGFQLTCAPGERLAIVWPAQTETGPNLVTSLYDPAAGVWSRDLNLTDDAALEGEFTSLFDADRKLIVLYEKEDQITATKDLRLLSRSLTHDVSVGNAGVTMNPPFPAAGAAARLTCLVTNTAELAVQDLSVSFYLGDPDSGGVLIDSAMVEPATLRAGDIGQAVLTWNTPAAPDNRAVFAVVDPQNQLSETDETNNRGSVIVASADPAAESCRVEEFADGSVSVIGGLINNGNITAVDLEVEFRMDDQAVGTIQIPNLPPGMRAEVSTRAFADLFSGDREISFSIVADPANRLTEPDEEDNEASATLTLGADTDGDGLPDSWERIHFGGLSRDGTGDFDGDNASDRLEYLAGTSPSDENSLFRGSIVRSVSPGELVIAWVADPGQTYQLQSSESLEAPVWTNLGDPMVVNDTTGRLTIQSSAAIGRRFYRVVAIRP